MRVSLFRNGSSGMPPTFSHGYLLIITLEPYPDQEILKRFARVFDQTYTRFLDLKKAETQARESEIQLALERVRARSMAMHQSDELADLSLELVKQVHALGIDTWFCAFNIYDDHPEGSIEWGSNGQGTFPRYRTPREVVFLDYYEAGQRGEALLINEIGEDECPAHYDYLCSLPGVGDQLLKMKEDGIPFPTSQIDHVAFFKYGYIIFITFEPVPEAHDIFKRFAKVFQQTYTRFLDLQKSEEQAREAKIEAALERVRARSMGMHKSDDLIDVVREIGKGIHELGIQLHYSQIYTDYTYDPKTGLNIWVDVEGQDYLEKFHLPYIDHTITLNFYNALNEGLDYFSDRYSKAEKDSYFKLLFKYSDLKRIPKKRKELILNASGWTRFTVILNEAALNFGRYSLDEFTDEEHEIFIRFAKVFGQAYTRFLDLKKAEEQAREAEIEAALERVRSRSLAMHKTDELQDVVRVVAEELKNTGVILDTGGAVICTYFQDSRDVIHWTATDDPAHPSVPYLLPYFEDELFDEAWESKSRGDDYFAKVFSYDVKNAFFNHAFEHSDYRLLPDEYKKIILESKSHGLAWAWAENSAIMIPSIQGDLPSEEERKILIRFAKVFEQSFIRFLDLQKAEAQAKEANIQLALERVRAKTMAMKTQGDLLGVIELFGEQLIAVGLKFGLVTFIEGPITKTRDWDLWSYTPEAGTPTQKILIPYIEHPYFLKTARNVEEYQKTGEPIQVKTFTKEEKNTFLPHYFKHHPTLPDEVKEFLYAKEGEAIVDAFLGEITVSYAKWDSTPPSEEELDIFERFAKEFRQTYIRFLDIKKAEEQARKAEIEASLERVRAKAMAMHSSKDIESATAVVFNELSRLGIDMERCGITIMNETPVAELWSTTLSRDNKKVTDIVTGYLDFRMHPILEKSYKDWQDKKDFSTYKLIGEEVKKYYAKLEKQPEYKFPKVASYPDQQVLHSFYFKEGAMFAFTIDELSAEAKDIIQKFTKVFAQTYTRFLDIQKAEAQAREAKIETALEKVRSRTMGMQSSDELPKVANLLFLEVQALGIPAWSCGYCILLEDRRSSTCIMSSEGTLQKPFLLPHSGESSFNEWDLFVQGEETFFTQELGGKAIESHYNFMKSLPQLGPIFKEIEEAGLSLPTYQINHLCKFAHGFLLFITYEKVPDAHDIFKRFTRVFEQTYTRFLDLKKAEAQALEATKQASLDRVRGEIASMRSAKDLEIITPLVWNELNTLGIPFIRCGVFIVHEEEEEVEVYLSKPDGTSLAVMHLPFGSSDLANQTVDAWKQDSVYTQHWTREEFLDWGRSMVEQGQVQDLKSYRGAEAPPESLNLHFIPFKQGMLYVGSTNPLNNEEIDLAASLAEAFAIAYARYEDFVKLEKAKEGIEIALADLKATQSQLVQQEKLASLGQLTAGIAHEIKNPLNFVNNFSELSVELIEEAREEVKEKLTADSHQLTAILDDIEANLRKIHEHGSRADSIVKSMLQHSRGGDGRMEPTDLNSLVKEYVNLAFHGMRAGKEPIDVDIKLDLDESFGEIPLIAEDFSRVILNVCNNGFDAMREKLGMVGGQSSVVYQPKLTVRTIAENGKVSVEIEDNGPGIPEEIKDKILQPFFTTKKGTQGTGLGLSITNDIIKAHGGSLLVDSSNSGTTMKIIINTSTRIHAENDL
jgi:signal transduction histidine kinase